MTIFLVMITFLMSASAWAGGPTDTSIVFLEDGLSAEGEKQFSRFEIDADNDVHWETSGEGVFCPSIAGTFIGKIDVSMKETLTALGLEAIKEQGADPKNDVLNLIQERQSLKKIYIIQEGQTSKASVTKGSTSYEKFYDMLMKVKKDLRPAQAVIMKANRLKADLQIRFELLGNGPFNLIFSKERPEEFMSGSAREVSYASKQERPTVRLTSKSRVHSFILKGRFTGLNQIRYSNSHTLHHADKKIPVKEVSLCAEF
ncbi:MAG: hypothetical protein HYV97_06475 [Bdellovibrio sp.]|nr:hypothetical protein [Bdellovibrio sp.]